jgi:hypothetical protein
MKLPRRQFLHLHRRKTTTKRSQRREHDQLPHPWVHLQDTFHFALMMKSNRRSWRGQSLRPRASFVACEGTISQTHSGAA